MSGLTGFLVFVIFCLAGLVTIIVITHIMGGV